MCLEEGLKNFSVEVVTNKPINLEAHPRVREIVVPPSYQTKTGALFKARSLQYCLEDSVNVLSNDDWIVHLDEETLLTPNSVRGIINFILDGKHQFGHGYVIYANENVVNWFTTLTDMLRIADTLGKYRFQLAFFHKPFLGFHGEFFIAQVSQVANL